MSNLTALKTSSVPCTTISKIPCAVPRNMLSPVFLTSMGGYIIVCSSIVDSTLRINSKSMKHFKFVLSRVLLMAYSSILLEYVLDSTYS